MAGAAFLDQTAEFWRSRTPRALTREDARQIVANVTGSFKLLAEWDRVASDETVTVGNAASAIPLGRE